MAKKLLKINFNFIGEKLEMQEPICNGCCCFSLRTGGLIIGWFNALVGCFGFVITISFLGYKLQEYSDETYVNLHNIYELTIVDKSACKYLILSWLNVLMDPK